MKYVYIVKEITQQSVHHQTANNLFTNSSKPRTFLKLFKFTIYYERLGRGLDNRTYMTRRLLTPF